MIEIVQSGLWEFSAREGDKLLAKAAFSVTTEGLTIEKVILFAEVSGLDLQDALYRAITSHVLPASVEKVRLPDGSVRTTEEVLHHSCKHEG